MKEIFDNLNKLSLATTPDEQRNYEKFEALIEKDIKELEGLIKDQELKNAEPYKQLTTFFVDTLAKNKDFKGIIVKEPGSFRQYTTFYNNYFKKQNKEEVNTWLNMSSTIENNMSVGEVTANAIQYLINNGFLNNSPLTNKEGQYIVNQELLETPEALATKGGFALDDLKNTGYYQLQEQKTNILLSTKQNIVKIFLHETAHTLDHLGNTEIEKQQKQLRSVKVVKNILLSGDTLQNTEKMKDLLKKISEIIGDPQLAKRVGEEKASSEIIAHTIPTLFREWKVDNETDTTACMVLYCVLSDTHQNYKDLGLENELINKVFTEKINQLNNQLEPFKGKEKELETDTSNSDSDKSNSSYSSDKDIDSDKSSSNYRSGERKRKDRGEDKKEDNPDSKKQNLVEHSVQQNQIDDKMVFKIANFIATTKTSISSSSNITPTFSKSRSPSPSKDGNSI